MRLLKVSFLAATMILISTALGMLMAIFAIVLGNMLAFSKVAGWVCGFAFLLICAANWRNIAKNMGLGTASLPEEIDR